MAAITSQVLLQARFGQAAENYAHVTPIQQIVAERLVAKALASTYQQFDNLRLMDVGAGPADYSWVLDRWLQPAEHLSVDLTLPMLKMQTQKQRSTARVKHVPVAADMHYLPFINQCIDMVYSNFALQWCHVATVIDEIYRIVKPGGWLVFAAPGEGTLNEYRQTCIDTKQPVRINRFPDYLQAIKQTRWRLDHFAQEQLSWPYHNVQAMLHAIKKTGANTLLNKDFNQINGSSTAMTAQPLTKTQLIQLEARYPRHPYHWFIQQKSLQKAIPEMVPAKLKVLLEAQFETSLYDQQISKLASLADTKSSFIAATYQVHYFCLQKTA